MIYNGKNELEARQAKERLQWLIENGKRFELTEKRKRRSLSQNAYLHVVLSFYALETGNDLEYVKQYLFKQIICPRIFEYDYTDKQSGEIVKRYRSTAKLNSKELSDAIDRFRNHASQELGLYIPEPSDLALIDQMENEIKKNEKWL